MAKKKPLLIALGDTHIEEKNGEIVRSIFTQTREVARKHGLKTVYFNGDLFHSRKGQVIPNFSTVDNILEDFENEEMKLEAIPGNHDKTNYSSSESFLMPFRYHPAFRLNEVGMCVQDDGENSIWMMPFFADQQYIELFPNVNAKKRNILITHIGVSGAVMNNGMMIETKINPQLFKNFKKVLIGHYHDPQMLSDSIQYIGAGLQHNYGEKPVKGATVLFDDLSTELFELSFPKYLAYEIDACQLTLKDIKELEVERKKSGDNLRIILTGSDAEIKSVDLQRLAMAGINVTKKKDDLKREDIEEKVVAFTDQSILSSFHEFCKKNKLDHEQGLQYLKKVLC